MKNPYDDILEDLKSLNMNISRWKSFLMALWSRFIDIEKKANDRGLYWNGKLKNSCSKFLGEIQRYAPWADLLKSDELREVKELEELETSLATVPFSKIGDYLNKICEKNQLLSKDTGGKKEALLGLIDNSRKEISNQCLKAKNVIGRLYNFVKATDFKVLYDKKRQLFSIGYDIEKDSLNNSYYDLLASAPLASFISIFKRYRTKT